MSEPDQRPPESELAAALRLLQDQQRQRIEACRSAIEEVLAAHGCLLLPEVTITGGEVRGTIRVVVAK